MLASIGMLLRLLGELVGTVLTPAVALIRSAAEALSIVLASEAGTATLVAATAAFALLALLAVAVSLVRSPVPAGDSAAPHPRRAIHDSTRLTETHPDAPGHSRPRAPGAVALAA